MGEFCPDDPCPRALPGHISSWPWHWRRARGATPKGNVKTARLIHVLSVTIARGWPTRRIEKHAHTQFKLLYSVVEALRRTDGVVKILGHSSEPVLSQLDLNATAQGTKRAAARPLSATPSLLPLPRRTLKLCSLCR